MEQQIIQSFFEGQCINAYEVFGAQLRFEDVDGVRFRVWAPHARSIQIIGNFNNWGEHVHMMEKVDDRGIYSLFVPYVKENDLYKYRVTQCDGTIVDKMDPFSYYNELRPKHASIVIDKDNFVWGDNRWMKKRTKNYDSPLNIYELHLGAWKLEDGKTPNYQSIAQPLIDYVKENHFTHVEFMPLSEHPFDGSWGYQASGYFSITSRYGSVNELKNLINSLHKNGIGVIFDFVPVHFVKDNFALNKFDGTHLYEYDNENAYSEWGTANFNLWKEEVRSFLMSAASYVLDKFHVDGIRMDAISNVIYWQGNKTRGVNEGGISFIKRMNYYLGKTYPTAMLIAEDSSDFMNVTKPTIEGGLGFDYKWDLGWMNDTLSYFKKDPVYRQYEHNKINFSMAYFYSERFILPFSHDEVVHGKATIVDKMWGLYEDKFRQARLLYTYMFTHPGKKLNFMSNEIGQLREFDEAEENDWFLLKYPMHDSFQKMFRDLSYIYCNHKAMYQYEYDHHYFEWIDADNSNENLFSYIRKGKDETIVVILNMSSNTYKDHYFGVLEKGNYKEIFNSDALEYSGTGMVNEKTRKAVEKFVDYKPYYISVDVAPFAGIILHHKNKK